MSAHSQNRRVTHLTLINARVISGLKEIVSESSKIVTGRGLMIYYLIELINVKNIYLM
jgi:hypothetical protein